VVRGDSQGKRALGDWQTPLALAEAAVAVVARVCAAPSVVLEPTCGEGAFLDAAARAYPDAQLVGYELRKDHAKRARARLPRDRTRVRAADFFEVDWERVIAAREGPLLIVGNPPWVTTATLGALGASNGPRRRRADGQSGLEALTGKSNFDLAEAVILRLLGALAGARSGARSGGARRATLAMLCKASVARRVIEHATAARWDVAPGGLYAIDALRHFGAAVSAVLFVCETGTGAPLGGAWPSFASLGARAPAASRIVVVDGVAIADADAHARTAHLAGDCAPVWRSGLKHDCAAVMELARDAQGDAWRNGLGEAVAIEPELVFPLAKGADLVGAQPATRQRAVVVPQRALGEDTATLAQRAPKAWRYLCAHRARLGARKSAVYRGRPEFSIFGVGAYAFAPWKVAVSGLHKSCAFVLLGPREGQPIVLDDTCYFLPFDDEAAARAALALLRSPLAQDFFAARVFWEAKRPISKAILQRLSLSALAAAAAAVAPNGAPPV
jgi:methylase of polypeptide subunit release factors